MNNKIKILLGLIFLIFISVSAVSANENITSLDETCDEVIAYDNYNEDEEAFISADDIETYYLSDKQIKVTVTDDCGNPLSNVNVVAKYHTGFSVDDYTDGNGRVYFEPYPAIGNHKVALSIDDNNYFADPVKVNVKISKAPVKLTVNTITTTNKYVTLKAVVRDTWYDLVNEGTVKFIINGKTYAVKVKNGVATKQIKLPKEKTYTLRVSYSGTHYQSKTTYSKVIVKKPTKMHTITKAGYTFKVTDAQYKRIQYVKQHTHTKHLSTYADFKVKTNKYYYGDPVYAVVTTWSGIRNGLPYNYPQVQFVVMNGQDTWDWEYLTVHYRL